MKTLIISPRMCGVYQPGDIVRHRDGTLHEFIRYLTSPLGPFDCNIQPVADREKTRVLAISSYLKYEER